MKWEGRQESRNVEDRRGMGRKAGLAIGGAGGVVALLIALFLGVDPTQLLRPAPQPNQPPSPEEERRAKFAKVVFNDNEVVWRELLGPKFQEPTLVLFSGFVESACGQADSAVGPFYCPGDSKVYIDLSFFEDMEKKLNAPGDFAWAYVIAHEYGHHVQRLLGYSARADEARKRFGHNSGEYRRMSVRLELQADYLAGVWAHHGQKKFAFLEKGDLEEAMKAAFEIGDDRLQKKARGYVVPDSFTHGTSKQRMRWFQKGLQTGSVNGARELFDLEYDAL